MTIKPIQALHRAEPFHPFVMHMADGSQILVQQRESLASAPSGRTVIVYQPDSSFNIVDLLLVTAVEVRAGGGASQSSGN